MAQLNELAITLIDNETGRALILPVRPIDDSAQYQDGEQQPKTVTILDVGSVDIPGSEVDLDAIGWNSYFPGYHDPTICDVPEASLLTPEQYRNQFSTWKDNGTVLQLVWPWAFLNKSMYVKSFTWTPPTANGDIFYTVGLREFKEIAPKKVSTSTGEVSSSKTAEDRPASPEGDNPKTYTVQAGDTLTTIAKKFGVTPWREQLYEKNKDTIGPNPNRIQVGQVLNL